MEYNFNYNQVKGRLVHFDAWRLERVEELDELGLQGYLKQGNVIVVEWAGAAENYFAKLANQKHVLIVNVQIEYLSESKRKLIIF
jgi:tRNA A37 threonylcarbamoyladenosine biosynthesis protein TsaE